MRDKKAPLKYMILAAASLEPCTREEILKRAGLYFPEASALVCGWTEELFAFLVAFDSLAEHPDGTLSLTRLGELNLDTFYERFGPPARPSFRIRGP